jgi:hypothetical protein
MYRYKAPHDGCTRHSIKGLKYINKLGKLISIQAYTVASKNKLKTGWNVFLNTHIRIKIIGENGTCIFGGFSWGYGGEGPRGLIELLKSCGMNQELATHYATSNALGEFNPNPKNCKLYNATILWEFQNSEIGWNLVID